MGPGLVLDGRFGFFFAERFDHRGPFPIPTVEKRDLVPDTKAHYIAQIVGLGCIKGKGRARAKALLDKKTGAKTGIRVHYGHTENIAVSMDIS